MKIVYATIIMLLTASLLACPHPTPREYLILCINTDASAKDKQTLKAYVQKVIDKTYDPSTSVLYEKDSNPTIRMRVGSWDVKRIRRKRVINSYYVNLWLRSNKDKFDNVNHIVAVKQIPAGWSPVVEE